MKVMTLKQEQNFLPDCECKRTIRMDRSTQTQEESCADPKDAMEFGVEHECASCVENG